MTITPVVLVTLFIAVIAHVQPVWRRPLYFGVAVPPGFQDERTLLIYRVINWVAAVGTLFLPQAMPLLQLCAIAASWLWARNKVWPHRDLQPATVRQASLRSHPPVDSRIWLWFLPPLVLLAATAYYLNLHFDQLPQRLAVHFNIEGQPDRWVEKSPYSVYAFIYIGLAMEALFAASVAVCIHGSRWTNQAGMARATVQSLVGSLNVVAVLFCAIALQPLFSGPNFPQWLIVAPIPVLLAVAIIPFLRLAGAPLDSHDPANSDDHWYWGVFYSNPNDPALMVPKRFGLGLTLNFAHPQARYGFPAAMILFYLVIFYVAR